MKHRPGRAPVLHWPILTAILVCWAAPAAAQPDDRPQPEARPGAALDQPLPRDAAAVLRQAAQALDAGEYQRAADLAQGVLASSGAAAVDRAEAWRLHGLASFFLQRFAQAEAAFVEYLKIEVDGRLDPALLPPEAIVFFEDVRARHAAELRKYRPRAESKRYWALNLLPPAGQFQNGQHTKAWILAGAGVALVATNIGTYTLLRRWCDPATGICKSGEASRTEAAQALRAVNLTSGVLLLGVIVYGIYDGFANYGASARSARTLSFQPCSSLDCGYFVLHRRF